MNEGDENQQTTEQIDSTLDLVEEEEQSIECDNSNMMQVNIEASECQTIDADVIDAGNQSPATTTAAEVVEEVVEMVTDATVTMSTDSNDDGNASQMNTSTTEPTAENSDSSSLPAIAEELPNGCSQDTKVSNELDAEMVSEDELPAPAQPTIDDAEDLSDDELPGPKRAELPADTEVVSEDEFPSSNKVKRKAEEIQETTTDEKADNPKKRAKTEVDSKFFD